MASILLPDCLMFNFLKLLSYLKFNKIFHELYRYNNKVYYFNL